MPSAKRLQAKNGVLVLKARGGCVACFKRREYSSEWNLNIDTFFLVSFETRKEVSHSIQPNLNNAKNNSGFLFF